MLPDLICTANMTLNSDITIRRVTNVCEVMKEVSMSKGMFSEVLCLINPVTTSMAEKTFSALRGSKT